MKWWLSIIVGMMVMSATAFAQGIHAPYVPAEDTFFLSPDAHDRRWEDVTGFPVVLLPQNITTPSKLTPSVSMVEVKAIHNGRWLAVHLQWNDPTEDHYIASELTSDACAIQFPVRGRGVSVSPFMGSRGAPVAIMHWKALWQHDIDHGPQQVTDLYPNTWVDTYLFGKNVAKDAGNPLAQLDRQSPVEELNAEGFGTLATQKKQNGIGQGIWNDGKWQVVFVRKMTSSDSNDPNFKAGETTDIGFAIWDGGSQDVGARKNYAMWTAFELEGVPK